MRALLNSLLQREQLAQWAEANAGPKPSDRGKCLIELMRYEYEQASAPADPAADAAEEVA